MFKASRVQYVPQIQATAAFLSGMLQEGNSAETLLWLECRAFGDKISQKAYKTAITLGDNS